MTAGKVFGTFRKLAVDRKVENVMAQLKGDLSNYRRYEEGPRVPAEDVFHYRAGVMQMAAFTPALLSFLSWPEGVRSDALKALESFLVRRMVCRGTTKDYNRMALDLVRELNRWEPERGAQAVVSFLSSQEADSRRWPTDDDLASAFRTLPLYRLLTRGRLRLVLEAIEERHREKHMAEETQVPRNLTIEHVLPQTWESHWPLPQEIDEQEARQERNRLVHTIGNLTLVTARLNPALSNGPWETKRATLHEHSVLLLNRQLLADYAAEPWAEKTIVARSLRMAKLVAKIWPGPDLSHSPGENK